MKICLLRAIFSPFSHKLEKVQKYLILNLKLSCFFCHWSALSPVVNILKFASYHTNYLTGGQVLGQLCQFQEEKQGPVEIRVKTSLKIWWIKWWCLIGKGRSCILEAHQLFKIEQFILFFLLGKKVFLRYSNGKTARIKLSVQTKVIFLVNGNWDSFSSHDCFWFFHRSPTLMICHLHY